MRLIDADPLLKSYDVAWMVEYDETGCGVRRKAIPIKCVEESPTIEAEPVRHGEWGSPIIVGYDGHHAIYAQPCRECGYECEIYRANFCPSCGAKMDGGDGA